jgi:ribosomal protein S18 acetylase RimI-like enzyme
MGSGIMNAFSEYTRRQGFTSLMLGVVEDNVAGLHFWQARGFKIIETSPPKPFGQKMQRVFKMQIFL